MDKKDLRYQILKKREMIATEEIIKRSNLLFEKIIDMDIFYKSECIMIYVSFEKEIHTHPFIKYCLKIGKKVVTPICDTSTNTLILGQTNKFPEEFKLTKYGILELDPSMVAHIPEEELDIIISPGLAFTEKGERLGYGGGYYDRLFEKISTKTVTIAPILKEFVVDAIPTESFDKRVDYLVTDDGVINCIEKIL